MTTITVRGLTPEVKTSIQVAAARAGRSMEEEIRQCLAAQYPPSGSLLEALAEVRKITGGVNLPTIPRTVDHQRVEF
ncbi:MAG: hypothetical protein Q4G30_10350 [Actinomycetaceae bacterium]|nr:hypothetical protein [Actinomycetaceae bacterium]